MKAIVAAPAEVRPAPNAPVLRRKCACGADGEQCDECKSGQLRRSALPGAAPAIAAPAMAPPAVSAALAEPGRALDPGVRGEMEKRLGHDFGKVRIHTGAPAERSADEVQAAAYTVGRHIVFGAGRYAPSSREGSRLLAHELVHTVQQGMAAYDGRPLPVGEGSAPEEQTAEAKARQL